VVCKPAEANGFSSKSLKKLDLLPCVRSGFRPPGRLKNCRPPRGAHPTISIEFSQLEKERRDRLELPNVRKIRVQPTFPSGTCRDSDSSASLARMKRPQRILLMLLSSAAVIWLVLRLMPGAIAFGVGVAVLLMVLVLAGWARHLMMARYHMRRRQWTKAIESYQRFEKMLLTSHYSGLLIPLYLGIYSLDGVAIVRNNIAQALMKLGKLDEADGWLRSALQQDPLYAIPYLNLGTIAAIQRQEALARRQFRTAVELGYSPIGAQKLLARALARGNEAFDK